MSGVLYQIKEIVLSVHNSFKYYYEVETKFRLLDDSCHRMDDLERSAMERRIRNEIIDRLELILAEKGKKLAMDKEIKAALKGKQDVLSAGLTRYFQIFSANLDQITSLDEQFIYFTLGFKRPELHGFIKITEELKNFFVRLEKEYLCFEYSFKYLNTTKDIKEDTPNTQKSFLCKNCKTMQPFSSKRKHIYQCYKHRKSLNNSSVNSNTVRNFDALFIFEDSENKETNIDSNIYNSLGQIESTFFIEKHPFGRKCIGLNKADFIDAPLRLNNFVQVSREGVKEIFYQVFLDKLATGCAAFTYHGLGAIKAPTLESFTVQVESLDKIFSATEITLECSDEFTPLTEELVIKHFKTARLVGCPIVFEKNQVVEFNFLLIKLTFSVVSIAGPEGLDRNETSTMVSPSINVSSVESVTDTPKGSSEIDRLCVSLSKLSTPSVEEDVTPVKTSTPVNRKTPKRGKKSAPKRLSMTQTKSSPSNETNGAQKKNKVNVSSCFFLDTNTKFNFISKPTISNKSINRDINYCKNEAYEELEFLLKLKMETKKDSIIVDWIGILIIGLSGSGKTFLVESICKELNLHLVLVNIITLIDCEDTISIMDELFNEAKSCKQWSIVLLDEVDVLLELESGEQCVNCVLRNMDDIKKRNLPVVVIGTTDNYSDLHSDVKTYNYFSKEIVSRLPNEEQRHTLFKAYTPFPLNCNEQLIKLTNGFTPRDIRDSIAKAYFEQFFANGEKELIPDSSIKMDEDILKLAIKDISRAKHGMRRAVKQTKWEDIYGYNILKGKLKDMIAAYKNDSINNPLQSFILYGPPGCSKTMFVRALAQESEFFFISARCSDLFSKFVGESEKGLVKLFNEAKMAAPAIIFLDEIDSLCSARSDVDSSWFVSELMSLMANSNRQKNIIVVGATNRPHTIDESLFAPDYFAWSFHVELPDMESRKDIWVGILNGINTIDIDYDELATESDGFSGAELVSIYQLTGTKLLQNLLIKTPSGVGVELTIHHRDLLVAIQATMPRTSKAVLDSFSVFYNKHK